jgi:hypothetical protein
MPVLPNLDAILAGPVLKPGLLNGPVRISYLGENMTREYCILESERSLILSPSILFILLTAVCMEDWTR